MGPKPAGLDGPPRHEPPQALEASLVPHRGLIAVDVLAPGTTWITPLATHERKELPRLNRGKARELSFDHDGFEVCDAVTEGGEAEAKPVEDVWSLRWYNSSDGTSFIFPHVVRWLAQMSTRTSIRRSLSGATGSSSSAMRKKRCAKLRGVQVASTLWRPHVPLVDVALYGAGT